MHAQFAVDHLRKQLRTMHDELLNACERFVKAIAGDHAPAKKSHAAEIITRLAALRNLVPPPEHPAWLAPFQGKLEQYTADRASAADALLHYMSVREAIQSHEWEVASGKPGEALDFDEIYTAYRSASKLPELLAAIIELLERMRDSGEIDSLSMMSALNSVIASLKQGAKGSYVSLRTAWEFFVALMRNYMWLELKKLPGLGTLFEALETTVAQANSELEDLGTRLQATVVERIGQRVAAAEAPRMAFLGYTPAGALSASDEAPRLRAQA